MRWSCKSEKKVELCQLPPSLDELRRELLENKNWQIKQLTGEANAFLLPHVRKHYFAYDQKFTSKKQTDKTLTLEYSPKDLSLRVEPGEGDKKRYTNPLECQIVKLRIHFHFDVFALEWELEETCSTKPQGIHKNNWEDYFDKGKSKTDFCLAQVMDVMARGVTYFQRLRPKRREQKPRKPKLP